MRGSLLSAEELKSLKMDKYGVIKGKKEENKIIFNFNDKEKERSVTPGTDE